MFQLEEISTYIKSVIAVTIGEIAIHNLPKRRWHILFYAKKLNIIFVRNHSIYVGNRLKGKM